MPDPIPFDLAALEKRRLTLIMIDLAAGTLTLRFADHVEVWRRVADPSKARRPMSLNGIGVACAGIMAFALGG